MTAAKYILFNLIFIANYAIAQDVTINNFIVRENLLKNEKISILAADADEKPIDTINGTFLFSVNGFKDELKFNNGIATASQQINKSTFVYLKHVNDNGTHAKLYYILKNGNDLHPFKISWIILLIIPLGLVAIGILFRKFIIIALILLVVIFLFNYSKGLGLSAFFDTVYNGLKSIF
jgi:hypothetical protein